MKKIILSFLILLFVGCINSEDNSSSLVEGFNNLGLKQNTVEGWLCGRERHLY